MMMDDRFDDQVREAARDYNTPPATPRDAMWARIEAARAESRAVIPLHRRLPRWSAWSVGLAAMLMIGIGIGRMTRIEPGAETPVEVTQQREPALPLDTGSAAPVPAVVDPPVVAAEDSGAPDVAVALSPGSGRQILPNGTRSGQRSDTRAAPRVVRPRANEHSPVLAGDAPRTGDAQSDLPYRFAAMQHLSRAEALLTSFEADTRAGRQDEQMQVWAGDLLSSTRLLLDSPAGRDPRMRPLLEDLELVLAQIRQAAQSRTSERGMVVEGIDARGVLPRIRTAIPAGPVPVGT